MKEGPEGRKKRAGLKFGAMRRRAGVAEAAIVFLVTIVCRGRLWVSRDTVKIMGFLWDFVNTCVLCEHY